MSYRNLGFKADPFSTKALQANEDGAALIVDREIEVSKLLRRIQESDKIPTIEGANGIGKTSIINIALHRLLLEATQDVANSLFVPCRCSFQLSKGQSTDQFLDNLYLQVALTLIEQKDLLRPPPGHAKVPMDEKLDQYINSPIIRSFTATILGNGGGLNAAPNTGAGWEKVGFRACVEGMLKVLFPTHEVGAVVCTIDNLEILRSSKEAKEAIEAFRDTAFSISGIKWILCGSSGIVRGVATSPRMVGWLQKPINILELPDNAAAKMFDTRVEAFRNTSNSRLPITQTNFTTLFDIFNGNARFVLDEAGSYCTWVFDEFEDPLEATDDAFERWLTNELETYYDEIFVTFSKDEKNTFVLMCQLELFLAGDASDVGLPDQKAFLAVTEKFIKYGLITASLDQDGLESTVFEITPKALKLQYFMDSQ